MTGKAKVKPCKPKLLTENISKLTEGFTFENPTTIFEYDIQLFSQNYYQRDIGSKRPNPAGVKLPSPFLSWVNSQQSLPCHLRACLAGQLALAGLGCKPTHWVLLAEP